MMKKMIFFGLAVPFQGQVLRDLKEVTPNVKAPTANNKRRVEAQQRSVCTVQGHELKKAVGYLAIKISFAKETGLILFVAALLLTLAGCGGGSSSAEIGGLPLQKISFYGDSAMTGTHSQSQTQWDPVQFDPTPANYIISLLDTSGRDYSKNGMSATEASILKDDSGIVVIRFGLADSIRGTSRQEFSLAIHRLVRESKALGKTPVMIGVNPMYGLDTRIFDGLVRETDAVFVDVLALPFSVKDLADDTHPGAHYSQGVGRAIAKCISNLNANLPTC